MTEDPQNETSPSEEQIGTLLSGFLPKPRQEFYQRMNKTPWNQENRSKFYYNHRVSSRIRLVSFTILTFLLILLPLLFTPSLLSNARQMFRFFWVHDENTRSIEVTYTPTSTSDSIFSESSFPLSIEEAAATAGYQLRTLTALPAGVILDGAAYDPTRHAVLIRYAGEGITLLFTQREKSRITEYASVGSDAAAEIVTVRGVQGEYIPGGWVVQPQSTPQPELQTQTVNLIWENQAGMATLRWEENEYVYEIVVTSLQNMSQAEILAIAESMR
jgi:hypothetical protein